MHASLVHSWETLDGRAALGVLVKRSYRLEPGRRASPVAEEPAIYDEPQWDESVEPACRPLVAESDRHAFERVVTDVLLVGAAYAPAGATTELETALALGPVQKRVRVRGDRQLRLGDAGEFSATAPESFVSLPLDWTRAYGGRDRHAEQLAASDPAADDAERLGTFTYPRNRAGRGYGIDVDRERLVGAPLPNLDDPDDPVEPGRLLGRDLLDWLDRPAAAGYGPIDLLTFPRCMFHLLRPDFAPPARPVRELALGALADADLGEPSWEVPMAPRMCNAAPAGLAVCRLEGGERLTLQHLHRRHPRLECELPGERPRLYVEPPGTRAYELAATLQSVLIEPDADRLILTWTGAMPVAAVFPEPMCREMRHGVRWER